MLGWHWATVALYRLPQTNCCAVNSLPQLTWMNANIIAPTVLLVRRTIESESLFHDDQFLPVQSHVIPKMAELRWVRISWGALYYLMVARIGKIWLSLNQLSYTIYYISFKHYCNYVESDIPCISCNTRNRKLCLFNYQLTHDYYSTLNECNHCFMILAGKMSQRRTWSLKFNQLQTSDSASHGKQGQTKPGCIDQTCRAPNE